MTAGSQLGGTSESFMWLPNDNAVAQWYLQVGSTQGGADIFAGPVDDTGYEVSGLPLDGSEVNVTLNFQIAGVWASVSAQYPASGP